jgi:hypothetical protein
MVGDRGKIAIAVNNGNPCSYRPRQLKSQLGAGLLSAPKKYVYKCVNKAGVELRL